MADELGRPTTNIGATDMRTVRPTGGRPPTAERDDPNAPKTARFIHQAPEWTTRWQQSATKPLEKGPWVVAYRFWRGRLAYEKDGVRVGPGVSGPAGDWIDCEHKGGFQRRHYVPESVANAFVELTRKNQSVGQWLHANLLVRRRNKYPGVNL